ncbi:hypothetical protein ACWF82_24780 [Nocardia sp. NPDC055053]
MIDLDRRMLLWNSLTCEEKCTRRAVFETMWITWPDWSIVWVGERDFDLNEYCAGRWPLCLVTVAGGPKARLYTSTFDLAALLEMGPHCSTRSPVG